MLKYLPGIVFLCSLSAIVSAGASIPAEGFAVSSTRGIPFSAISSQMAGTTLASHITPEKTDEVIDLVMLELRRYNPLSIKRNKEYGGIIYEKNGVLQSSSPIVSGQCKSGCELDFSDSFNSLLKEAKTEHIVIYADWHTHARGTSRFSEGDKKGMRYTMSELHKRGHPYIGCFLVNASNDYLMLTHNKNESFKRRSFKSHLIEINGYAKDSYIVHH